MREQSHYEAQRKSFSGGENCKAQVSEAGKNLPCLCYITKAIVVDRAEKGRERMVRNEFKEMEDTRALQVKDRSLDFILIALQEAYGRFDRKSNIT